MDQIMQRGERLPPHSHLPDKPDMIDVKQAVAAAEEFARQLFSDQELRHLRVEEVELVNTGGVWNITLGWVEPARYEKQRGLIGEMGPAVQKLPRVYKLFAVDAKNGSVQSMKIREVA
jgi:hypothetical protein